MIRHIWFDMGGTLYRETPAFNEVHDALRYQSYSDIVGQTDILEAKREYDELYKKHGSNSAVFTSLGKPSDYWQNLFDGINLLGVITPNPEVTETLKQLSILTPVSLFTNFTAQKIQSVLTLLNVDRAIFTHILSGDDVRKRKPDLEGFKRIIELSDVPPEQIVYVGDRVDVDIKPANDLGIQTCLIYGTSDKANYSATNFKDLLKVIH